MGLGINNLEVPFRLASIIQEGILISHYQSRASEASEQWPNETVICPFVRRRMFGAQKRPNIRFRTNVRLRPNIRYFTEYSAILTNI